MISLLSEIFEYFDSFISSWNHLRAFRSKLTIPQSILDTQISFSSKFCSLYEAITPIRYGADFKNIPDPEIALKWAMSLTASFNLKQNCSLSFTSKVSLVRSSLNIVGKDTDSHKDSFSTSIIFRTYILLALGIHSLSIFKMAKSILSEQYNLFAKEACFTISSSNLDSSKYLFTVISLSLLIATVELPSWNICFAVMM